MKKIFSIICSFILLFVFVGCNEPKLQTMDLYVLAVEAGYIGTEAEFYAILEGQNGENGLNGQDGETPFIGENGHWWIGETDTGVSVETLQVFTVTFQDMNDQIPDALVQSGSTIDLPIPTRSGYRFLGWYAGIGTDCTKFTSFDGIFCDLDLYPKWEASTEFSHSEGLSFTYSEMFDYYVVQLDDGLGGFERFHLEEIIIPSKFDDGIHGVKEVSSIGFSAFSGCVSVRNILIPETVSSIGQFAFGNMWALEEIVLPSGLSYLGEGAFSHCKNLKTISFRAPNGTYEVVDGVLYGWDRSVLFCYPAGKTETSFIVPDSVNRIAMKAFENAALAEVNLGARITEIPSFCFNDCKNLISVSIPENVTIIGNSVFGGCDALGSLSLPGGLTQIGDYAFSDCLSLVNLTVPATVSAVGASAFLNWSTTQTISFQCSSSASAAWHADWMAYCQANLIWNE